jgi:hypothetical protein
MMNFDNDPHTVDTISFWTSGTRKQCIGQYSWCFNKPVGVDKMFDLQTLASSRSNGACVLATFKQYYTNDGNYYSFLNEDCNAKMGNVCFFDGAEYKRPTFSKVRM